MAPLLANPLTMAPFCPPRMVVAFTLVLALVHTSASTSRVELSILSFGGKADGVFNNQAAIAKAMAACDTHGGCTLRFPIGSAPVPTPAPYHPWGPPPLAVYRTSAINLTSHLRLVLDEGATRLRLTFRLCNPHLLFHGVLSVITRCGLPYTCRITW